MVFERLPHWPTDAWTVYHYTLHYLSGGGLFTARSQIL